MNEYKVKFVRDRNHDKRYCFISSMLDYISSVLSSLEECGLDFHRNFKVEYQQGNGSHDWSVYIDGQKIIDCRDNVMTLSPIAVTGGKWGNIINHPNFMPIDKDE